MVDSDIAFHTSLVVDKTQVAPIKRLTVPRLELCGAVLLAKLLHHVARMLEVPLDGTFAWTDSLVVLGWLQGSPQNLKTFVGNRVSIPSWNSSHLTAGIMSVLRTIQMTASLEGYSPLNYDSHKLWWKMAGKWLERTRACRTHCDNVRTIGRKVSHENSFNSSCTTSFFRL